MPEFVYFCPSKFFDHMAKKDQTKEETLVDVQQVYTKTEMFLEKNRKALTVGIGAIALIFAGFFSYQNFIKKPKEIEAANAVIMADLWSEMDSLEMAVNGKDGHEGYEALASKYEGTAVGKRAHFWCGVYYRDVKADYATALEHFKKADFDDNTVGIQTVAAVGDMYIQQGNIEEGAAWLDKAVRKASKSESKDFTVPFYGLKAAKAFLELGNNNKAKDILQDIVDNYDKKGQDYSEAAKLLAFVKAQG